MQPVPVKIDTVPCSKDFEVRGRIGASAGVTEEESRPYIVRGIIHLCAISPEAVLGELSMPYYHVLYLRRAPFSAPLTPN